MLFQLPILFLLGLRNHYFFSLCHTPTFESFVGDFCSLLFPGLSAILWTSGSWCETTSRRSRNWLISSPSPHVPNMVLAKMNNYEHQSKPTYASYTFQVLMSFCLQVTIVTIMLSITGFSLSTGWCKKIRITEYSRFECTKMFSVFWCFSEEPVTEDDSMLATGENESTT